MKTFQLSAPAGLDALQVVEKPEESCGPRDVRVEMKAWSLNRRDLGVSMSAYGRNDKIVREPPLIPLSDGAGEVIEVGSQVTEFAVGDRVASCFFRDWQGGDPTEAGLRSALGGGVDGILAEQVVLPEHGWVKAPGNLDHDEVACLPCAGLTAWNAVTTGGIQAGQNVLALGTGGVSIFALQFAKVHGARVLITSSSEDKLEQARLLGTDETINYRDKPEWQLEVLALTNDIGVDRVIEVGGADTLNKSLASTRIGGCISLVGLLSGTEGTLATMNAITNAITMRGVFVGSRTSFKKMNRAIELNDIRPTIDRRFGFELNEVKAAYEHLRSSTHLGKIVITRD